MAVILKGEALETELRGREPLTGSIKLRERDSDSEVVYDEFKIEGVMHAGSSCICYKATRFFENSYMSESGTLKEFYPADSENDPTLSYNLKRHDIDAGDLAKQLYSEESTLSNFTYAQNEFYECYKKISDIKSDNEENDSFFAPIHIYRGIPEKNGSQNYTIYIWNPGDSSLKSFDDHLSEMQKRINAAIKASGGNINFLLAQELHTVLQAIKALASGIQNLHYDNLLHLDIKPSNFGIRNPGENNGDNVSVSLFDVNTIYSRSNPLARTGGTPHFRAPEMIDDVHNNARAVPVGCLSDVYSLGATLYNALIIGAEERGLYEVYKFSDIDTELSRSLLFEYSEYNSKAEIHDSLANILKRSLARTDKDYWHGTKNYLSVGEFLADISEADELVKSQLTIAREEGTDKKATLHVVNKEDYYDEKIDGGAVSAMQCLLYDYPLYDYVDNGKLNVLVLGAGVFGQKFIDIAFELSQIKNCFLNITVLSKEKKKDEARYLNSRPDFKKYFYVDGQKPLYDDYGAYGSIKFVGIDPHYEGGFSAEAGNNADILKNSLGASDEKFGYVFISLSDESLNRRLACDLAESEELLSSNAIVNFVSYKDPEKEYRIKKENAEELDACQLPDVFFDEAECQVLLNNIKLNPVFIKNTLMRHDDYRLLNRMAFNCHLLWGDGLNVDINKSYSDFRSGYNYSGSFANALSVSYKLRSLGLDLKKITSEKNRKDREEKLRVLTLEYRKKIGFGCEKSQEQIRTINELTMYEHRRWNVNMICSSSYTELSADEYKNLRSSNKDKRNRKHTCIVPSAEDRTLNEPLWQNLSKWDEEDLEQSEDFMKLDPLDKMSVRLHRHFMSLSKDFNMDAVENDAGIIRRYLSDKPEALAAFNAYLIAMRTITARKARNDTAQETFKHCAEAFSKSVKDTGLLNTEEIEKRIRGIEEAFEPVRMAYDYTDYKSKDQTLVYNIPFILNYSTSTRLCIPFVKGKSNNEWFENVASSIVINPSTVTYLVDIDEPEKIISSVKDNLLNITRVMDGHSLQTGIALVLYVEAKESVIEENKKAELEKELKAISSRIYSIDIIEIENREELASRIRKTIETNQNSSSGFSAIEINGDFIRELVHSINALAIPVYEFNSMTKAFRAEGDEDAYIWFSDIPFNTHLHIEDMFLAQGRLSVYRESELYQDYKEIWYNCYSDADCSAIPKKASGWHALCSAVRNKTVEDDILMAISVNGSNSNKTAVTDIFVPSFCRAAVRKILEFLAASEIQLTDECNIIEHSSSMIRVSFSSSEETKNAFSGLFRNPYALADETRIKLTFDGSFVRIYLESLTVNDFSYNAVIHEAQNDSKVIEYAKNAFLYLIDKGYIILFSGAADSENVSFCFASSQIKELLVNESSLLKLYAYYQTIEKGYFDEIKAGLEVQHKKADNEYSATHEFDLIAIKGFRSLIVEVNAKGRAGEDFRQQLKAKGDEFGINKELVLVSLSCDNPADRDDEYGILSVSEPYEIGNIGDALIGIMNRNSDS